MDSDNFHLLATRLHAVLSPLGFLSDATVEQRAIERGDFPFDRPLRQWSCRWAAVFLRHTTSTTLMDDSDLFEVWARRTYHLPQRNYPRKDWYLLLAIEEPVNREVVHRVEGTDRVLRRHVVECGDNGWDLGRVPFLPIDAETGGYDTMVETALPREAHRILVKMAAKGGVLTKTVDEIDEEARTEARGNR